ncbi:hypothetical protein HK104_001404 [Borealophlyctis nickersoniae]|nr:hypothetical protein HK104_001404 [Borealophlyctis nickersoniae]
MAPKTGLDLDPATLAKNSKKPTAIQRRFPIPLMALMVGFFACITVAIVAPSSYIFLKNAYTTVEDTALTITNLTTESTRKEITRIMQIFQGVSRDIGIRPSTKHVMTNNRAKLRGEMTYQPREGWVSEMFYALDQYPYPIISSEDVDFGFMDWSTNGSLVSVWGGNNWDTVVWRSPIDQPYPYGDKLVNMSKQWTYQQMQKRPAVPTESGQWSLEYIRAWNTTYWQHQVNFYNETGDTTPVYCCQAASAVEDTLYPYLAGNLPSPNSVVMLLDSKNNGSVIVTSENKTAVQQIAPNTWGSYSILDAHNSKLRQIGHFLKDANNGDITTMNGSHEYKATLDDGKIWNIGTATIIPDGDNVWQVVVAFIDGSIKGSSIIISVLTVVGMVCMAVFSVIVTMPLRKLGRWMGEVTNMKFGALEGGALERRSMIVEIGRLEESFDTMVKAFASGIRLNSDLLSNKYKSGLTSGTSTANGNSSVISPSPSVMGNASTAP